MLFLISQVIHKIHNIYEFHFYSSIYIDLKYIKLIRKIEIKWSLTMKILRRVKKIKELIYIEYEDYGVYDYIYR